MTAKERLCVALDVADTAAALQLGRELKDFVGLFKIGLELFTSEGPEVVRAVAQLGLKIFLDLKFHDIPNTAAGAARAAARLGVAMFNVHAVGGKHMIRAAVDAAAEEAAKAGMERPRVLAVTILTSVDEATLNELRMRGSLTEAVRHFAVLAQAAGADGVIASPQETELIRSACGPNFLIVTPGVRPAGTGAGDQKRTTTPREAVLAGSDYIVVGRPITVAKDRREACRQIVAEMTVNE